MMANTEICKNPSTIGKMLRLLGDRLCMIDSLGAYRRWLAEQDPVSVLDMVFGNFDMNDCHGVAMPPPNKKKEAMRRQIGNRFRKIGGIYQTEKLFRDIDALIAINGVGGRVRSIGNDDRRVDEFVIGEMDDVIYRTALTPSDNRVVDARFYSPKGVFYGNRYGSSYAKDLYYRYQKKTIAEKIRRLRPILVLNDMDVTSSDHLKAYLLDLLISVYFLPFFMLLEKILSGEVSEYSKNALETYIDTRSRRGLCVGPHTWVLGIVNFAVDNCDYADDTCGERAWNWSQFGHTNQIHCVMFALISAKPEMGGNGTIVCPYYHRIVKAMRTIRRMRRSPAECAEALQNASEVSKSDDSDQ